MVVMSGNLPFESEIPIGVFEGGEFEDSGSREIGKHNLLTKS